MTEHVPVTEAELLEVIEDAYHRNSGYNLSQWEAEAKAVWRYLYVDRTISTEQT